jgi:hypothetical protein
MSRLAETFILVAVAAVLVAGLMVYARISTRVEPTSRRPTDYIGVVDNDDKKAQPSQSNPAQLEIPAAPSRVARVGSVKAGNRLRVAALPGVPQIDPGLPVDLEMAAPVGAAALDNEEVLKKGAIKKEKEDSKDKKKKESEPITAKEEVVQGIQPGSKEELLVLRKAQKTLNRLYQLRLRGYTTPAMAEQEARKLVNLIDQLPLSTRKRVRAIIDGGYGKATQPTALQGTLDAQGAEAADVTKAELGKVDSTPGDVKKLNSQIKALRTKVEVNRSGSSSTPKSSGGAYKAPKVEGSLDKEVKAQDL